MFTIFKFLILASGAFFVVLLLTSGAIGYFLYSSNNSSSVELPSSLNLNWQDFYNIPREVLMSGAIALVAIWVLIGKPADKEDGKSESRKGRRRRYLDEE